MAGITPMTILRNCYFHGDVDEYLAPSGHVHYNWQIYTSLIIFFSFFCQQSIHGGGTTVEEKEIERET